MQLHKMMKRILLLADVNSPHTQKWVVSLINSGFDIAVFTLSKSTLDWHKGLDNFQLFEKYGFSKEVFLSSKFSKLRFLNVVPELKKIISTYKPDILHAHYASSYGLIGALTGFHPFIISAWGSDVFTFPQEGFLNKLILKFNFRKADVILSTGQVMKSEISKYTSKEVFITPFGVDTEHFKPMPYQKSEELIIGTIKRMEDTYGISYLIRAFKILTQRYRNVPMRLLLVGDGAQTESYKKLVRDLDLEPMVTFTGLIPHNEIVTFHNKLDIFAALSLSESFGVAVLEASACEKPVVVTNVGGLPEVAINNYTGFIVQPANIEDAALALSKLVEDAQLRAELGSNGRKFVIENYQWSRCVDIMADIYNNCSE